MTNLSYGWVDADGGDPPWVHAELTPVRPRPSVLSSGKGVSTKTIHLKSTTGAGSQQVEPGPYKVKVSFGDPVKGSYTGAGWIPQTEITIAGDAMDLAEAINAAQVSPPPNWVSVIGSMNLMSKAVGDATYVRSVNGVPVDPVTGNVDVAADSPGYDLVLPVGQSNMSGRGVGFTSTTDPINLRIDQFKSKAPNKNTIVPASEPLDMHDTPSGIGPALQFARHYAARRLRPGRKVLLVPVAHGGTPLVSNASPLSWRRGVSGNLYEFMITQAQAALAAANAAMPGGEHRIVVMLWCQGETDGDGNITGPTYQADFDALLNGARADLGIPDLPIVVITMVPEYLSTGTRAQINAIHRETPIRVARTDVALGATGQNLGDGNHYNAAGFRLNGKAAFDAYDRIMEGLSPYFEEFRPAQVTGVTVTPGTGSLAVTWPAAARATSYLVEHRVTADGGAWTNGGTVTSLSRVLSDQPIGVERDVRVTSINAGASAAPSAIVTGTPAAAVTVATAGVLVTALGAYSVSRRVVSNYAGNLVKIRRASDNVEQDFGGTALDVSAVGTFLGSSDGFVSCLYDQTGAGQHVVQTTAGLQPKIATAGVVITSGGKPALSFDGTDDMLVYAGDLGAYAAGAATACQVISAAAPTAQKRAWAQGNSASSGFQYGLLQPDGSAAGKFDKAFPVVAGAISDGSVASTISAWDSAIHQMSATDTGTAMSQWVDAAASLTGHAYTRSAGWTHNRFAIGGVSRSGSAANFAMTFSELVIWGTAFGTADRQTAEANQKAFYSTP